MKNLNCFGQVTRISEVIGMYLLTHELISDSDPVPIEVGDIWLLIDLSTVAF